MGDKIYGHTIDDCWRIDFDSFILNYNAVISGYSHLCIGKYIWWMVISSKIAKYIRILEPNMGRR